MVCIRLRLAVHTIIVPHFVDRNHGEGSDTKRWKARISLKKAVGVFLLRRLGLKQWAQSLGKTIEDEIALEIAKGDLLVEISIEVRVCSQSLDLVVSIV